MTTIIEGISHLNSEQLSKLVNDPNSEVIIIDVREPEEYREGHIPGIPLIPMGNMPDLIEDFDKSCEYVFVCRSGARSLNVAKFFKNSGIENVHNYEGGMLAWDDDVSVGDEHIITQFSMEALQRKNG